MMFPEAKSKFSSLKVDELRNKILWRYNWMSPKECNVCKYEYNDEDCLDSVVCCFICYSQLCPKCSPPITLPKKFLPDCDTFT